MVTCMERHDQVGAKGAQPHITRLCKLNAEAGETPLKQRRAHRDCGSELGERTIFVLSFRPLFRERCRSIVKRRRGENSDALAAL